MTLLGANRVCALLVLCCVVATAETATPSAPTLLHASNEKLLSVPAFGYFGSAQADSEGDIFIHPAPFGELNILKVSPSSDTTVFKLPDQENKKYAFYSYNVTPGGVVCALVNEVGSSDLRLIEFDSHGTPKTPILFQIPEHVEVARFLALDSGMLLVSGEYTAGASKELLGRPFLGILNNSGILIKTLHDGIPSSHLVKIRVQRGCLHRRR